MKQNNKLNILLLTKHTMLENKMGSYEENEGCFTLWGIIDQPVVIIPYTQFLT